MHVVFLSLRFPQDVSSLIALTRLQLINEVKVLGGTGSDGTRLDSHGFCLLKK